MGGRAGYVLIPGFIIAACAIIAPLYFKDSLPEFCVENATQVLLAVAGFEMVLLTAAAFVATRKMMLTKGVIYYESWLSSREIFVSDITDLSVQREEASEDTDRKALSVLLREMAATHPDILVAREVRSQLVS